MVRKVFRIVAKVSIASLLLAIVFQFNILPAKAAALTGVSATLERLKVSEFSNQTIQFTSTSGVVNGDMIAITYPTGEFGGIGGKGGLGQDDVEVKNMTTNHVYTDDSAMCSGEEIYVQVGANVINLNFCPGAGGSVGAGNVLKIFIGAFTDETTEDGDFKIINPMTTGTKIISIYTGPSGMSINPPDTGKAAVYIVDSDQVNVRANIDPTLTFDIDVATSDTETAAPYELDLGTLAKTAVKTSDNTSIKSIWIDLETNATSGATVTVLGAMGGLASTATAHTIGGVNDTLVAGTEGTGICVTSTTGLTGVAPYENANCDATTHEVGKVNTTATNILNSGGAPVENGRAEIMVKASISAVTPAANDYADTFTFIATATF